MLLPVTVERILIIAGICEIYSFKSPELHCLISLIVPSLSLMTQKLRFGDPECFQIPMLSHLMSSKLANRDQVNKEGSIVGNMDRCTNAQSLVWIRTCKNGNKFFAVKRSSPKSKQWCIGIIFVSRSVWSESKHLFVHLVVIPRSKNFFI